MEESVKRAFERHYQYSSGHYEILSPQGLSLSGRVFAFIGYDANDEDTLEVALNAASFGHIVVLRPAKDEQKENPDASFDGDRKDWELKLSRYGSETSLKHAVGRANHQANCVWIYVKVKIPYWKAYNAIKGKLLQQQRAGTPLQLQRIILVIEKEYHEVPIEEMRLK